MADPRDLGRPYGIRIDPVTRGPIEVLDESEHFTVCVQCGQAFDRRDMLDTFHHMEAGHEPLPTN